MNCNWVRQALLKKTLKSRVCDVLAVFVTIAIYNTNATWIAFKPEDYKDTNKYKPSGVDSWQMLAGSPWFTLTSILRQLF